MVPSKILHTLAALLLIACVCSCSNNGPMSVFKKQSPHDAYGQKLKDAGLDRTAMGGTWLANANQSISRALNITLPYKEIGYFAADKNQVTALRFEARKGEKLNIVVSKRPETFKIYTDLLQEADNNPPKVVAWADTTGPAFSYEIGKTGKYIIRLQPELLRGGEYTLTISVGPSLSFPVSALGKPHIGSFWGADRDGGGRRHEGIDIFAPRGTPAIAAADGTVSRVTVNSLGGNVVFMRPEGSDYNLYYAHLDKQLVQDGQTVRTGDTLGLVGNTGNARTTSPHLHFGVYTSGGAVDPLPFVNREIKIPRPVTAVLTLLNATGRIVNKSKLYVEPSEKAYAGTDLPLSTALSVEAATDGWYKVKLPDGHSGFVQSRNVKLATPLRKLTLKSEQPLLDGPDSALAARKTLIAAGNQVEILGTYRDYYLVTHDEETGWLQAAK
jgi:murein DD-endopeptidase MepM/ murein hydrolase activator NlpD